MNELEYRVPEAFNVKATVEELVETIHEFEKTRSDPTGYAGTFKQLCEIYAPSDPVFVIRRGAFMSVVIGGTVVDIDNARETEYVSERLLRSLVLRKLYPESSEAPDCS